MIITIKVTYWINQSSFHSLQNDLIEREKERERERERENEVEVKRSENEVGLKLG